MSKYDEMRVYDPEIIAQDHELWNAYDDGIIKRCYLCNRYVHYTNYQNEHICSDGTYLYDACDGCVEAIENGRDTDEVSDLTVDDFIDEVEDEDYE